MAGPRHITNNLLDNETDLLYKGLPIATTQSYGRVSFVSPTGNDATALQGRMDRPYRTIQAAVNAPYINTNVIDKIMVLGGNWNENVTFTRNNVFLHFVNANLSGGAGSAIASGQYGTLALILENSEISNNSASATVAVGGRIIGIGRSRIFNIGTGIAVYGSGATIHNMRIENAGNTTTPADFPALWAVDCKVTNTNCISTNSNACVAQRYHNSHILFENCSFYSANQAAVRPDRGGSFYRNCQMRSVNGFGMISSGAWNRLENCQIYSDNHHAMAHYGGGSGNSHINCIFKGALDCIFSDWYGHSHHAGSENMMGRFDNCEFYAGTGQVFNYTFDMYENVQAGVRIQIANSKMNKAYAFTSDPRVNPAYRFREWNNMVIPGLPCLYEFMITPY
ncbi:hypothetical protein Q0590_25065 [Rhodocytophaga aerolata]|uniref:Right-handed parallel beta-helix repeat-containing protein n=1 Tax=Rhodocytophaga aerolata TaxID=455078 RepID=A0ABT8RBU4_9BACT|nr:hypothetical protein [Rhodocytophaga aerolata]MDO1449572.1 hypothetical protein [Rhodocytophaga aerolata]